MENTDSEWRFVNTETLAKVFDVSERQIPRLVKAGVITPCNDGQKPYQFDLFVVCPQYMVFLSSGIPMHQWAPNA